MFYLYASKETALVPSEHSLISMQAKHISVADDLDPTVLNAVHASIQQAKTGIVAALDTIVKAGENLARGQLRLKAPVISKLAWQGGARVSEAVALYLSHVAVSRAHHWPTIRSSWHHDEPPSQENQIISRWPEMSRVASASEKAAVVLKFSQKARGLDFPSF